MGMWAPEKERERDFILVSLTHFLTHPTPLVRGGGEKKGKKNEKGHQTNQPHAGGRRRRRKSHNSSGQGLFLGINFYAPRAGRQKKRQGMCALLFRLLLLRLRLQLSISIPNPFLSLDGRILSVCGDETLSSRPPPPPPKKIFLSRGWISSTLASLPASDGRRTTTQRNCA